MAKYREYRKFDVVYVDLGRGISGSEKGLRPCIVVSSDKSNHSGASIMTVVPLTKKIKRNPVHVVVTQNDIVGYGINYPSDFLTENMVTISKGQVVADIGYAAYDTGVREKINAAIIKQLALDGVYTE